MKNILLVITVIALSFFAQTSNAAGGDELKVSNTVLEAFNKDFILTSNANWYRLNDLLAVDFTQTGIPYTAYYTEDGELSAISQVIEKSELPLMVSAKIARKFKNDEILTVLKVRSIDQGVSYVIHLVAGNLQKIVKTDPDGTVEKIRKIK